MLLPISGAAPPPPDVFFPAEQVCQACHTTCRELEGGLTQRPKGPPASASFLASPNVMPPSSHMLPHVPTCFMDKASASESVRHQLCKLCQQDGTNAFDKHVRFTSGSFQTLRLPAWPVSCGAASTAPQTACPPPAQTRVFASRDLMQARCPPRQSDLQPVPPPVHPLPAQVRASGMRHSKEVNLSVTCTARTESCGVWAITSTQLPRWSRPHHEVRLECCIHAALSFWLAGRLGEGMPKHTHPRDIDRKRCSSRRSTRATL